MTLMLGADNTLPPNFFVAGAYPLPHFFYTTVQAPRIAHRATSIIACAA